MCRTNASAISVFAVVVLAGCGSRGSGPPARPATPESSSLEVGKTYRLKVDCFGGATEKALDRGQQLVEAKNQAEFDEMFNARELVKLEAGTRVRIESLTSDRKAKVWKAKVWIAGHDRVVWVHQAWVQ
jgi:hypothetical protein